MAGRDQDDADRASLKQDVSGVLKEYEQLSSESGRLANGELPDELLANLRRSFEQPDQSKRPLASDKERRARLADIQRVGEKLKKMPSAPPGVHSGGGRVFAPTGQTQPHTPAKMGADEWLRLMKPELLRQQTHKLQVQKKDLLNRAQVRARVWSVLCPIPRVLGLCSIIGGLDPSDTTAFEHLGGLLRDLLTLDSAARPDHASSGQVAGGLAAGGASSVGEPERVSQTMPKSDEARPGAAGEPTTAAAPEQPTAAVVALADKAARRTAIDAFILKCKQETSLNATRTQIWRAAGHSSPRQFQFWQASDPKATTQDDQNFRRILAMTPTDFEALLKKKGFT